MIKLRMAAGVIGLMLVLFFVLQKPHVPVVPAGDENMNNTPIPIENQPGVTNVKKFSDLNKRISDVKNATNNPANRAYTRPSPTPKPLPYPRIEINYSLQSMSSINGISADNDQIFILVTMEIRNFGYRYFDAHPTKFRIVNYNTAIEPSVNISTRDILDAVLPNNSMTRGELIFSADKHFGSTKLAYVSGDYQILWHRS